ncbi:MAG: hypothetical protein ACR2RE_12875 [Geminicoccaceae bacterium]
MNKTDAEKQCDIEKYLAFLSTLWQSHVVFATSVLSAAEEAFKKQTPDP